ncbi:MAG: SPOR domain-containing protein [Azoarcus sp.]|nr:SPOR domain-containing protein [Azoarcus sp.]
MSDLPANDADELEIKKRARRRLVGAVALALLAVFLLPLAMDGGSPPPAPDMQVFIPPSDSAPPTAIDADTGKINIEPDTVTPGLVEFPPPSPPVIADPLPRSAPDPLPPVVPDPVPATQPPPVTQTLPATQTPPPATQTPTPSTDTASRDDEATRALALLNGKTIPPPDKDKSKDKGRNKGRVYIQVASFGDAARAEALAAKLKKQGFAAHAEKAGKVNRVRIGPLARAEAEQVAARLKAKGHGALLLSR